MSKNPRDFLVKMNLDVVKLIMEDRGLGRNALAKLLEKDPSEVRMWLNGDRRPTLINAKNIADALECTIEQLTGKEPFIPKDQKNANPISPAIIQGEDGTPSP